MKRAAVACALAGAAVLLASCGLDPVCVEGSTGCVAPGCADGVRGQAEVDVDCGGGCAPCGLGASCSADGDCASGHCVSSACCQAPCPVWSAMYGSSVDDYVTAVARDARGAIYLAGVFGGAVDFGGGALASRGGSDAFLLKLAADGSLIYNVSLGGTADDRAVAIVVHDDARVTLALATTSEQISAGAVSSEVAGSENVVLAELDPSGSPTGFVALGTGADDRIGPSDVIAAGDGDLFVVGAYERVSLTNGDTHVSHGLKDVFFARLSPAGDVRFFQGFGDAWNEYGGALAPTGDGGVAMTVLYSRSWSFGGAPLPDAYGTYSLGVASFDGDGQHRHSRGFGDALGEQRPADLAVDASGTLYVGGTFSAPMDIGTEILLPGIEWGAFVLALAPDLSTTWGKSFGAHTASIHSLWPDEQGGVLMAGPFRGDLDFGDGQRLETGLDNVFAAYLDAGGHPLWARNFGGTSSALTRGIPLGPDRWLLAGGVTGQFHPQGLDALDEGDPSMSNGGVDAFVTVFAR